MAIFSNIKPIIILCFLACGFFANAFNPNKTTKKTYNTKKVYEQIGNHTLSFTAFEMAMKGLEQLQDSLNIKTNLISVLDFSQPSTNKRYYLIDLNSQRVVYQDYVAHGKNTGGLMAKHFSNTVNSYKSSLGFYLTAETYMGKHGLSLRLDGLEKGINDRARERAIVVHAADYAEESFIKNYKRLGRSFGCPALPSKNYKHIVELIKDGSLLFIYAPQVTYLQKSVVLN